MSNYSPLTKGLTYYVKVTGITEARRTFQKPGTNIKLHVHDVYAEDHVSGAKYKAEYLTETEKQTAFSVGVLQYFKCVDRNQYADIVEPYEPGTDTQDKKVVLDTANRNVPITGTTYSLAMMAAKDLTVARITSDINFTFDGGGKEFMFEVAEEINNWLVSKRDGL